MFYFHRYYALASMLDSDRAVRPFASLPPVRLLGAPA